MTENQSRKSTDNANRRSEDSLKFGIKKNKRTERMTKDGANTRPLDDAVYEEKEYCGYAEIENDDVDFIIRKSRDV